MSRCEAWLKLAANGMYERAGPVVEKWFRNKPKVCYVYLVMVVGPIQDPLSGSDSQPLFATAHPGSGAPFLGMVVTLTYRARIR